MPHCGFRFLERATRIAEDKKVEDIAAELDNTELGVRSLIKRGKAALRLYESDLEIYR